MANALEDRLQALSRVDYDASLDGLEGAILGEVDRRRRTAAALASPGAQIGLAAAALAIGLAMGMGAGGTVSKPGSAYGSEVRVLSDVGLAPSIRLGGA